MNTPAHIAASLFAWRGEPGWPAAAAVTLGAVLPDLPMFGFYAYQKAIGTSEREIWSDHYFRESWQLFFDIFNSFPLMLLIAGVCYFLGVRWGVLMALSAMLHLCCDLPLHHDDAHRHFLPFTNWRFASPFSYWDPRHHGATFMWIELVLAVGSCIFVGWTTEHFPIRAVAFGTLALYAAGIVFALVMWLPLSAGS